MKKKEIKYQFPWQLLFKPTSAKLLTSPNEQLNSVWVFWRITRVFLRNRKRFTHVRYLYPVNNLVIFYKGKFEFHFGGKFVFHFGGKFEFHLKENLVSSFWNFLKIVLILFYVFWSYKVLFLTSYFFGYDFIDCVLKELCWVYRLSL